MDYVINNEKLMAEWDWDKNNKINLNPKELTCGSNKYAWWVCKNGHKWQSMINSRNRCSGCPYCSGKLITQGVNDLLTTHPMLAKEWNYKKNQFLLPSKVSKGSQKKVWWECKVCSHEWEAPVYSRVAGNGCPICGLQRRVKNNIKNQISKYGSLQDNAPRIALEWNYAKNGNLTPNDVMAMSSKKVWWICSRSHEWETAVYERVTGRGCPYCASEMQSSFPEQAILYYCNKVTKAENRNTTFGKEIDIYLPEHKIAIEYNGTYWHKNREEFDIAKNKFLRELGLRVITVIESDDNKIIDDIIYYKYGKSLDWCIVQLFNMIKLPCCNINVEKDANNIYDQYIFLQKENSLQTLYPHIAAEWHPIKNGNLTPDMVTSKSSKKVWWLDAYGHEWCSAICNRTKNGAGCPFCKINQQKIAIYCCELNIVFKGGCDGKKQTKASHILDCCRGLRKSAGKHPMTGEPLHWHYLYDQTRRDGTLIPGAITLGLITEEEALNKLNAQQND